MTKECKHFPYKWLWMQSLYEHNVVWSTKIIDNDPSQEKTDGMVTWLPLFSKSLVDYNLHPIEAWRWCKAGKQHCNMVFKMSIHSASIQFNLTENLITSFWILTE